MPLGIRFAFAFALAGCSLLDWSGLENSTTPDSAGSGIQFLGESDAVTNGTSIVLSIPAGAQPGDVVWIAIIALNGAKLSQTSLDEFAATQVPESYCGGYNSAFLGKSLSSSDMANGTLEVDFASTDKLSGVLSAFHGAKLAPSSSSHSNWFEETSVQVTIGPGFDWVAAVAEDTGTWGPVSGLHSVYTGGFLGVYEGASTASSIAVMPPAVAGNCGAYFAVTLEPM
jgi:hypothetical protein